MPPEEFDARRLTLARWSVGMTKREVADRVGVSAASISQYEAGNTQPRPDVSRRIAFALGVPIEYLYGFTDRRSPRLEARSFFRSLRSTRQWQRDQADAISEHLYDLVEYLDRRLRLPTVDIPAIPVSLDRPSRTPVERAAFLVRERWDMPNGPVSHAVRLLEAHGAIVARLPGIDHQVDAFSRWFEKRPVVLLSAQKQDKGRSRFDSAHELGHLILHQEPEPSDRALERQAHVFAANFLMPADEVIGSLPARLSRPEHWEQLFEARSRWGVSTAALLYRARELNVLSEASFRRSMTHLNRMGLRRHDGNALGEPEQPRLLMEAVLRMRDEFGLGPEDLAAELRFSERQMNQILGSNIQSQYEEQPAKSHDDRPNERRVLRSI